MNKLMANGLVKPASICLLLLLSACASIGGSKVSIEQRATERWDLLFSDNLTAAYDYLSPGYRSSVSLKQYQRTILLQRIKWTSAKYNESECAETSCKVKISLDYTVYGALPGVKSFDGTQEIEESWVKVEGKWYFVPNK